VLSIFGIAATLVAFAALQRYLARRVPARRVRKHECPFCGYPVRKNQRCEGCGRDVVAECTTCHEDRRVGTLHCGSCGAA
jgi:transcription elongation factor Elf1